MKNSFSKNYGWAILIGLGIVCQGLWRTTHKGHNSSLESEIQSSSSSEVKRSTPQSVTATSSSMSSLAPAPQVAIDLNSPLLDPEIKSIAQREQNEKSYLLKEVGLSLNQYQEIQEQRRKVYAQLKDVESWAKAFGISPNQAKEKILAQHISWMQSTIGVGHYNHLLEL